MYCIYWQIWNKKNAHSENIYPIVGCCAATALPPCLSAWLGLLQLTHLGQNLFEVVIEFKQPQFHEIVSITPILYADQTLLSDIFLQIVKVS